MSASHIILSSLLVAGILKTRRRATGEKVAGHEMSEMSTHLWDATHSTAN